MDKELKMWVENETIIIKVNEAYEYGAKIYGLGTTKDKPSGYTMWSWVNHLREKIWWNNINEKKFIFLSKTILK